MGAPECHVAGVLLEEYHGGAAAPLLLAPVRRPHEPGMQAHAVGGGEPDILVSQAKGVGVGGVLVRDSRQAGHVDLHRGVRRGEVGVSTGQGRRAGAPRMCGWRTLTIFSWRKYSRPSATLTTPPTCGEERQDEGAELRNKPFTCVKGLNRRAAPVAAAAASGSKRRAGGTCIAAWGGCRRAEGLEAVHAAHGTAAGRQTGLRALSTYRSGELGQHIQPAHPRFDKYTLNWSLLS